MENPLHKHGAVIGFGGGLPVWPKTQNVSVGADSISARGRSRRRGVRRDGASRPTVARIEAAIPFGPKQKKLFVGAGFIPPAEPCATVFPRLVSVFPPLRRAGVHARRTLAISKSKPCAAANRADISGLRAGPAVFGLRNAPAGAVESAPTGVAISRGLRLPGIPARKKMKKFLIPHS